jgi:peptidoglycan DL-endopeptidase CwlO
MSSTGRELWGSPHQLKEVLSMKKLTILLLCVVCVLVTSLTFAQGTDKPAAKPETSKAEAAKAEMKTEAPKTEAKAVAAAPAGVKLGTEFKCENPVALDKVAEMVGKEVIISGIIVDMDAKGAWIKLGEKEKVTVNAATGWTFPLDCKGMKACVSGKVEKKETAIVVNAAGAELTKEEMKKEEMKKEEVKKEEPKKEEPKKEEPKKEEPKTTK